MLDDAPGSAGSIVTIQEDEQAQMNRREFGKQSLAFALVLGGKESNPFASSAPTFSTHDAAWQEAYDKALSILEHNVRTLPRFEGQVLIEGAEYAGIWQECGPHEALVYRRFRPDVARNSHMVFFALQREDGQLPANNKLTEAGFGQIQMVVPIAATAWELARATNDEELLDAAYRACSRWDAWLMRYRNTRGTGLIEGFCTYDTGMDNSPRWARMANQCPGKDAKKCPPDPTLPRLCPDLSATVYGARVALSEMAEGLGKMPEAEQWKESADHIRQLIVSKLYSAEGGAFYDLDAKDHFVKVRTCAVARVCAEHVVEQALFDDLWTRQLHNPKAFWAPFPLPSVALDDPTFVRPIPRNSWGGASQALTALRTGRWFDFYGRSAEFGTLMDSWCRAIERDMTFRQQIDPETGAFTQEDEPNYSPAALVMMDFTWRLAGIHEDRDEIQWNVRPGHPASDHARFRLATDDGAIAEMKYGKTGATTLLLNKAEVCRVEGTARLVTDKKGKPLHLLGISEKPEQVVFKSHAGTRRMNIGPNERPAL
jgi:hypothetical protein